MSTSSSDSDTMAGDDPEAGGAILTLSRCLRLSLFVFLASFVGCSFLYERMDNGIKRKSHLLALSKRSPRRTSNDNDFRRISQCDDGHNVRLSDNTFCPNSRFDNLLLPSQVCYGDDVTFMVAITSAPHSFVKRETIRRTWLSESNKNGKFRHVFLLGTTNNSTLKEQLSLEAKTYKDILMGNYHDDYRNLTLKTITGLNFFYHYCKNVKYMIRCDDDIFINTRRLLDYFVENLNHTVESMYGTCCYGHTVRDPASPWYLSRESFPDDFLPHYCKGPGYVLSRPLITRLVKVIPRVTIIPVDDVFLGVCVRRLGIRFSGDIPGFNIPITDIDLTNDAGYAKLDKSLTIHKVPVNQMEKLQTAVEALYRSDVMEVV